MGDSGGSTRRSGYLFDEKLATKASTVCIGGLVTDTNACYDKSAKACKAVKQLVTLGSISKVAGLEHKLV